MRTTSSSSAGVRWADPDGVEQAVLHLAEWLRRERTGIREIHWFGSWVNGTPTPSSDVDICIIVDRDDRPARERVPDYMPGRFRQPLDLMVLTDEEWAALPETAPGLYRAIRAGRSL